MMPMTLNGTRLILIVCPIASRCPNNCFAVAVPSTATRQAFHCPTHPNTAPALHRNFAPAESPASCLSRLCLYCYRLPQPAHSLETPERRAQYRDNTRYRPMNRHLRASTLLRNQLPSARRFAETPGATKIRFEPMLCTCSVIAALLPAHSQQRDHRRYADDYPEHCQTGAQLVCAERTKRDTECFKQIHTNVVRTNQRDSFCALRIVIAVVVRIAQCGERRKIRGQLATVNTCAPCVQSAPHLCFLVVRQAQCYYHLLEGLPVK